MIKKCSIFLLIFAIICAGITYGLISEKNKANQVKIEGSSGDRIIPKKKKEIENGTSSNQKYNQNDLILEKYTLDYKGKAFEVINISGLKDKKIENKINEEILATIKEIINEHEENALLYDCNFSIYANSNFSNVLSLNVYLYWSYDEKHDISSISRYLNYDLTTGNKLKLEDIFVKGADIDAMVRDSMYRDLLSQTYSEEVFFNEDYNWDGEPYYSNKIDEEKYIRKYKEYLNATKKEFYFYPNYLYIEYYMDNTKNSETEYANIDLARHADKVNIYTKFVKDESIFERDDIGVKNIYVFTTSYDDEFLEDISNNARIDVTISFSEGSEYSNQELSKIPRESIDKNSILNRVIAERDKIEEEAIKNDDKFYYVAGNLTRYPVSKWNYETSVSSYARLECESGYICKYVMDIDTFNNFFENKIIFTSDSFGGIEKTPYLEDEEKALLEYYNEESINNVYDKESGKLVTTIEEICNPEDDYMTYFVSYLIEKMNITEERAREVIANHEYEFQSYGIKFNDQTTLYYEDIPMDILNIWY